MHQGSAARGALGVTALIVAVLVGIAGVRPADAVDGLNTGTPTGSLAEEAFDPIDLERTYAPTPEDRFAMAGGCYAVRSVLTGGYVASAAGTFTATAPDAAGAERVGFQAFDLGKYLLHVAAAELEPYQAQDFLAAAPEAVGGELDGSHAAVDGMLQGTGDETLDPVRDPIVGTSRSAAALARAARGQAQVLVNGAVVRSADPGPHAEWIVREAGDGSFTFHLPVNDGAPDDPGPDDTAGSAPIAGTLVAEDGGALAVAPASAAPGAAARFTLEATTGCPEWPEIGVDVEGDPAHGESADDEARGFIDAHLHMMAFEFLGGRARCGRPWHPYGVTYALVDCEDHEPGGRGAVLEQVLSGGSPLAGHDTEGWPGFGYWPKYNSLTHEQVYYRWMERAWRGGLRSFVNLLVDNGVLCEVYPYKDNSCNEMDGVRLQAQRLRELERYIDAQWGGPGEGWFRIVTSPGEARRTINEGRLAVIMGIEVSVLFDCGEYLGVPRCSEQDIEQRLDEVYDLGVRQMELVNKFDNALSGVTGDGGETGIIVNQGNRWETGHYWKMHTCDPDHEHEGHPAVRDKTQINFNDGYGGQRPPEQMRDGLTGRDALAGGVFKVFGDSGAAPVYPEGPHCNEAGLTDLGEFLLEQMMARGMMFDPDHMSARARHEALDVLEGHGYSGVVSSHSWADDLVYERVLGMGGFVAPYAGGASGFVNQWRKQRAWADGEYFFGIGYGADTNGFGSQGGPRNPAAGNGVAYPFTGFGGVTVDRQVSGEQVFDVNTDGVDHYGLYPDWIEDLRLIADSDSDPTTSGADILEDLARGPEAYLQTWERAIAHAGG